MTQMAAAAGAMEFGTHHAMAAVGGGFDRAGQRRIEAGPAGAAFELGAGVKKLGAAASAFKLARPLFLEQTAGTGPLGSVFAQNAVLFRGQGAFGHKSFLSPFNMGAGG
jgi:hypothetical protein